MSKILNQYYSALSGKGIGAGMIAPINNPPPTGLPSWLPPAGTMAWVNLNTVDAAADTSNPDPWLNDSDLAAMLNAWCSTVWCPNYGPLGSIVLSGGGHGDRLSNAVYRYDVATRLTTRITNGTPIPIRGKRDFDYVAGNVPAGQISNPYGEFWSDDTRSAVLVDQMGPTHTYGNMVYVSGDAAGNTNGFVVVMGNFNFIAHHIDLDHPETGWHRTCDLFTTVMPQAVPISYGSSVFDPKRKRIVSWPYSNAAASFAVTLDFPSRALHAPPSGSLQSYYTLANYMAADDKYLVARLQPFNGVWQMEVVDPDNLANKVQTKQTGPMPPAGVLTFTWDESRRQWVGWDSADANLWICQAPADPVNGTWVWSQRPYTAQDTIVKQTGVNHMFNRLHYINALDSFICIARVDGPIQFWKA